MKGALVVLGVVVLAAIIIGSYLFGVKNDLVRQQNDIQGKWAQVDNGLKRRADLIPNLVETARG